MKRVAGLDFIRGLGIFGVLALHFALYRFGGLFDIDRGNPNALATLIGFLLMWAGLFASISGAVLVLAWDRRSSAGERPFGAAARRAFGLLIVAYAYFVAFGPGLIDFEAGTIDFGLLPGLIVYGRLIPPSSERLLYVDSLIMIAFSVFFVALALRPQRIEKGSIGLRNWAAMAAAGLTTLALGAFRILLFPLYQELESAGGCFPLFPINLLLNKNNPIVPYIAFGFFGAAAGLSALAKEEERPRIRLSSCILGAVLAVGGLAAYFLWPETMLKREIDGTWFCIVVFQCGFFLLLTQAAIDPSFRRKTENARGPGPIVRVFTLYGTRGLSAFVFEPVLTAALGRLLDSAAPGWNTSMPAMVAYGIAYAALWGLILKLWARAAWAGGADWALGLLLARLGSPSRRMEAAD